MLLQVQCEGEYRPYCTELIAFAHTYIALYVSYIAQILKCKACVAT